MSAITELERMKKANEKFLGNFVDVTRSLESIDRQRAGIFKRALSEIRPFLVTLFVNRYNRSGIVTKTGELLGAVRSLNVAYRNGGLYITLGGAGDKINAKSAALNYGAVYAPKMNMQLKDLPTGESRGLSVRSILGEKAKRTVKKAVFGGKILSRREKVAQGAIESESLRFLKPRRFFTLNNAERRLVVEEFNKIVNQEMIALGVK